MSARRFTTHVDVPLSDVGFASVEERLATTPETYTVGGLYFADLTKAIRTDWSELSPKLLDPPKDGRYLPFRSYPMRDHARLALEAARTLHPGVSMRESVRRLHRGNMRTFLQSKLGSVISALVRDVRDAYLRTPEAFRQSREGGTVTARAIEERAVEITMARSNPWLDCADLGTLEGLGLHYDVNVRVEVELATPCDATYVVRWR